MDRKRLISFALACIGRKRLILFTAACLVCIASLAALANAYFSRKVDTTNSTPAGILDREVFLSGWSGGQVTEGAQYVRELLGASAQQTGAVQAGDLAGSGNPNDQSFVLEQDGNKPSHVPIPGTLWLIGPGLAALVVLREQVRRR